MHYFSKFLLLRGVNLVDHTKTGNSRKDFFLINFSDFNSQLPFSADELGVFGEHLMGEGKTREKILDKTLLVISRIHLLPDDALGSAAPNIIILLAKVFSRSFFGSDSFHDILPFPRRL